MISQTKKFIFVHIPGTGGTSIENSLKSHVWGSVSTGGSGIISPSPELKTLISNADVDQYYNKNYKHATILDYKKILPDDVFKSYYKFTIVRHPLKKARSMCNFTRIGGKDLKAVRNKTESEPWLWKQDYFIEEKETNLLNKIYYFEDIFNSPGGWKTIFNDLNISLPEKLPHTNNRSKTGKNKSPVPDVDKFFSGEVRSYLKTYLQLDYSKYYPNIDE